MSTRETTLLLATTNAAKLRRLRWLVEGLPLRCLSPAEVGLSTLVEESGPTHEANACLKARAWSRAIPGLVMASDGGAAIPALGDRWQSLSTARFAGETATDRQRVEALLALARLRRGEERRVWWVEGLAIARRGRVLASWQVDGAEGYLAEGYAEEHFNTGFWLATLWSFPALGKRYGQLDEQELALVDDHWTRLKGLVQAFFRAHTAG